MLQPSPVNSDKRVLIVDDDRAIYNACHLLLKHYEFDVLVAPTLAQARLHLASRPHLVLLDLSLPDGDGVQLLGAIRRGSAGTRVFVLTGDMTAGTEARVRRLSPDRYFHKPLNFIEVLEAMRECLEESTPAAKAGELRW
jgi:two-component system KDP operon response regulator KdpE